MFLALTAVTRNKKLFHDIWDRNSPINFPFTERLFYKASFFQMPNPMSNIVLVFY